MNYHPYGPAPESYGQILSDIRNLLAGKACVSENSTSLETLIRYALPAITNRFCELAASAGRDISQFTSADVLACVAHNRENKLIELALYQSFPSYSLDRFIAERNGFWNLHKHQVHYESDDPNHNRSVVAQSLISRITHKPMPTWQSVLDKELNTTSERESSIQGIQVLIPRHIRGFDEIEVGDLVAADVIYYEPNHRAAGNQIRNWGLILVDRFGEMEQIVGELHQLSKAATALSAETEVGFLDRIREFVSREGKTLREIAAKIYEFATQV